MPSLANDVARRRVFPGGNRVPHRHGLIFRKRHADLAPVHCPLSDWPQPTMVPPPRSSVHTVLALGPLRDYGYAVARPGDFVP